jgi:acetyl-CoA synthetase
MEVRGVGGMIKARIKAENHEVNLRPHAEIYKVLFPWSEVEKEFSWHQSGKINIVHEAIDQWTEKPEKQKHRSHILEKGGEKNFTT